MFASPVGLPYLAGPLQEIAVTGNLWYRSNAKQGEHAMRCRQRQAYETLCRDLVQHTEDRLDRLRSIVERLAHQGREELERELDALRGQHNRVIARIESVHRATDDAWLFAQAKADQAIAELMGGLDALENQLKQRAA